MSDKEQFDPEKVRNYTLANIQFEPAGQHYVKASDYDKLLALYRETEDGWVPVETRWRVDHKYVRPDFCELFESEAEALAYLNKPYNENCTQVVRLDTRSAVIASRPPQARKDDAGK